MLLRPPISTLFPYTTLFRSTLSLPPQVRHLSRWSRRLAKDGALKNVSRRAKGDRKSTRLNSSHITISYAVFCLKKKNKQCPRAGCGVNESIPGRLMLCRKRKLGFGRRVSHYKAQHRRQTRVRRERMPAREKWQCRSTPLCCRSQESRSVRSGRAGARRQ